MNIGFVHLNLSTESGDPRMFFMICRELVSLHHRVIIYTSEFNPKAFPDLHAGIPVHIIPPPSPLASVTGAKGIFPKVAERLRKRRLYSQIVRRLATELDPSLDLIVFQNDESYHAASAYRARNPGAKIVWIMNNTPFYHVPKANFALNVLSRCSAFIERRRVLHYVRGVDLVVVHDKEHEAIAVSFGKPVFRRYIPVDFKSFAATPRAPGLGTKRVTFLDIGSLSPSRKYEDVIRAVALLRRDGYDARAILVCNDFWRDVSYRKFLTDLVTETKVGDAIDFRFSSVSEEELRACQRASDIFVFPQHIVIWGMAALEAMAAGLPLIVSRVTSIAEVLRDGEEALFVDPGHPEQIAEAAKRLLRDPKFALRIAEAGQCFVRDKLSWLQYVEALLRAVDALPKNS